MNFSVCILVHEWHEKLPDILNAYSSCADEILLGINGDFQPQRYPVLSAFPKLRLLPLMWQGYGTTRNQLSAQAIHDWVLHTDLDELPDEALQQQLREWDPVHPGQLFALRMQHYFGDRPIRYGAWGRGKKWFLRLYNRRFTSWDDQAVHESLQAPAGADIVRLEGRIRHYTANDEAVLRRKSLHYAMLYRQRYLNRQRRLPRWKTLLSPAFTFIKQYLFQCGFLDGRAGFQIARANALYTYWKYCRPV